MFLEHQQAWKCDHSPENLFQRLTILSVRHFFLISNLNFLWCSLKPFPLITRHQKEEISTFLCCPSQGSCRQEWGQGSASSFLNWTNPVSSAVPPESHPMVLSPSLLPAFGHILIFTCPSQNYTQDARWGSTKAKHSGTSTHFNQ